VPDENPLDDGVQKQAPAEKEWEVTPAFILVAALVIAVMAYLPSIHYDFVYDDTTQIVQNKFLTSWHIKEYFTQHVWAGYSPESAGVYYRPVFLVWARCMHALFGFDLPPEGWHLGNIFLHLGVTALLFFFIRQFTGNSRIAAWTALLFCAHPAHVEPVVWISSVPELLMGLFALLMLMAYLHYVRHGGFVWLALSALAFAVALFTKETSLMLVPLAYFLHRWESQKNDVASPGRIKPSFGRALTLIIFAIVICTYMALRVHAVQGAGSGDFSKGAVTLSLTFPSFVWFYIKHLILPIPVSPIYDADWVKPVNWWWMLGPLMASVAFIAFLIWMSRKNTTLKFAVWMIGLTIFPALAGTISFYRWDMVHDRYLYLPCMGWCLLLAWVAEQFVAKHGRALMTHITLATVAALFGLYSIQVGHPYQDNITLFQWAVRCSPENHLARQKLADAYMIAHRYEEGIAMFRSYYQPGDFVKEQLMGAALYAANRFEEAEPYLARASTSTSVNPVLEVVHHNWAILGMTRFYLKKYPEAELAFRNAILMGPREAGYHFGLALTLEAEGRYAEAREQYQLEMLVSDNALSRDSVKRMDELIAHGNIPANKEKKR